LPAGHLDRGRELDVEQLELELVLEGIHRR
jgi:hypothetical protein